MFSLKKGIGGYPSLRNYTAARCLLNAIRYLLQTYRPAAVA